MSLRELRQALKQTQVSVAQRLGVNQENVSRLEQRDDLLLSTLSRYIAAMGGKLSLVVEHPDRPPIALTQIGALDREYSEEEGPFKVTALGQRWNEQDPRPPQ